ncbi:flavodoxin [compost metagenome]
MPQAMSTFFEEYDFAGKTIVPFGTHKGSRFGSSLSDIDRLLPDSTILGGFTVWGDDASSAGGDVQKWLQDIDLIP